MLPPRAPEHRSSDRNDVFIIYHWAACLMGEGKRLLINVEAIPWKKVFDGRMEVFRLTHLKYHQRQSNALAHTHPWHT